MTRLVRGADGRTWTIRSRLEWANPATGDDFEHEVSVSHTPGVFMAILIGLLVVVLVAWTPSSVVVPMWFILSLVLVFLFFPARWAARRPWTVVAETPGGLDDQPAERWVGQVRGVFAVRQEASRIAREIEVYSSPGLEGPLQPVD